MDSDQGKLFIGGVSWETTEEKLKEHFENYGEVSQTVIMRDKNTGRPRGFAFVVFADPSILDRVLQDRHTIDGRTVEAKRALSREEQHTTSRSGGNTNAGRSFTGAGNIKTKKIFVGGLPPTLTEEGFCQYFENYGHVTDVVIMYDQNTQRPRGFGFISFESEEAVDNVLHKTFHELNGKTVEVKRALPKDANPGNGSRSAGGAGYQGYGSSGMNTTSYDGGMDSNRYMQPQAAGGGFSAYGSSAYGATGYGYGAANNGVGYGGYGVGAYGGANPGYTGPAGAYGSPNAPNSGYVSGPPGAPRSPWNNQASSGYGSAGYGANTGYAATTAWSGPGSGGNISAPTGQSPGGATSYGNQGYGFGGYGSNEGPYVNPGGGYGAVAGRGAGAASSNAAAGGGGADLQGAGSGYMGSGYGDVNGNAGYQNAGWRDPSQGGGYGASQASGPAGGQVGYGGGYSGAQARQPQPQ